VTLPAFAAERRCPRSTRPQLSIDISCPQGAQQQTRQRPLLLSMGQTDGLNGRHDELMTLSDFQFHMCRSNCVRGCQLASRAFQFGQKSFFRFDSILATESIFSIRFDSAI